MTRKPTPPAAPVPATPEPPEAFVICPMCGNEQADMGRNVACEECGEGPMPTADEPRA